MDMNEAVQLSDEQLELMPTPQLVIAFNALAEAGGQTKIARFATRGIGIKRTTQLVNAVRNQRANDARHGLFNGMEPETIEETQPVETIEETQPVETIEEAQPAETFAVDIEPDEAPPETVESEAHEMQYAGIDLIGEEPTVAMIEEASSQTDEQIDAMPMSQLVRTHNALAGLAGKKTTSRFNTRKNAVKRTLEVVHRVREWREETAKAFREASENPGKLEDLFIVIEADADEKEAKKAKPAKKAAKAEPAKKAAKAKPAKAKPAKAKPAKKPAKAKPAKKAAKAKPAKKRITVEAANDRPDHFRVKIERNTRTAKAAVARMEAAAPPVGKPAKAKKQPRITFGSQCKAMIMQGLANEAIWNILQPEFDKPDSAKWHVGWWRGHLRRKGIYTKPAR